MSLPGSFERRVRRMHAQGADIAFGSEPFLDVSIKWWIRITTGPDDPDGCRPRAGCCHLAMVAVAHIHTDRTDDLLHRALDDLLLQQGHTKTTTKTT